MPSPPRSVIDPRPEGDRARDGESGGGGGTREGDLDVMSATSSASGHAQASRSTASVRERRAQVASSFAVMVTMVLLLLLLLFSVVYDDRIVVAEAEGEDVVYDEGEEKDIDLFHAVGDPWSSEELVANERGQKLGLEEKFH